MPPVVLDEDGYQFFFYSREVFGGRMEKPHVHVRKGGGEAKVWIDSAEVVHSRGFSPAELRAIRAIVLERGYLLRRVWDEYFREPPSDVR